MKYYFRSLFIPIFYRIREFLFFFRRIKKILIAYVFLPKEQSNLNIDSSYEMFQKEQMQKCYDHFKDDFLNSVFVEAKSLDLYALNKAIKNYNFKDDNFFLEFGVFRGLSINYLAKKIKPRKIYGFDSFEGLKEDWVGTDVIKGWFDLGGNIPKLDTNVVPVKGWVQDTLDPFLQAHNPLVAFAHMDLDTYQSTLYVLKKIKPFLRKGSILLFDEMYNFPGWSVGEYKALTEVFNKNEYRIVAFAKDGWSAAIEIN
jgi:hypothetical protein